MARLKQLLFALLLARALGAQPVPQRPDCYLPFTFATGVSVPSNTTAYDNRVSGCTTWQITYNSTVFSALSILVQTAPNASGVPGSWSTFTAVTGSNPNTATTQAVSTFGGPTSYFPWLRVQLTSATGAGTISGQLYGWRIPATATAVISGTVDTDLTEVGGVAISLGQKAMAASLPVVIASNQSNLPVVGPAADGAAVSGAPVRVGGKDGSGNTQDVVTDTSGNLQVQEIGNAAVISGRQTVTASAVALATNTARNICVKALAANGAAVYIGPSGVATTTGLELGAGQGWCGPVTNTNLIFVIAAAAVGDGVTWIATN